MIAIGIVLVLLIGLWQWDVYQVEQRITYLLGRARADPTFRHAQLSKIPPGLLYGHWAMSETLTLATGEPYTPKVLLESWRLTFAVEGDTFVFESDSSLAAFRGKSFLWERTR